MDMKRFVTLALIFFSMNIYASPSYTDVIVFGDSLSDVGNLDFMNYPGGAAEGQTYGPRFSNGPLVVEYIASELLGVDDIEQALQPSLHLTGNIIGSNFAVAAAKSLDDDGSLLTPDINLPTQVNAYLAAQQGIAHDNALFFLSIGGNDVRAARDIVLSDSNIENAIKNRLSAYSYVYDSVTSTAENLNLLLKSGAKDIMILGTPNMALTPESALITNQLIESSSNSLEKLSAMSLPKLVSDLSKFYQFNLKYEIKKLQKRYPGSNLIYIDLMKLVDSVNKQPEHFGFTNTTHACNYILSTFPVAEPTSECLVDQGYLYFDELHPTTKANLIVAERALKQLISVKH